VCVRCVCVSLGGFPRNLPLRNEMTWINESWEREREQRLWTVSLYTCFPITFLFSFSWKIRSRFYSTWASHHCASPRRRISSKRRSVEYPTLMCVMRWGSWLRWWKHAVKKSFSLSLSRTSKRKPFTQQWPPVMVNFLFYIFLSTLLSAAYKNQESVKLWQWAEKPDGKLATIFIFRLFPLGKYSNWYEWGVFLFPHIFEKIVVARDASRAFCRWSKKN
jgi:hypothetical protein